MCTKTTEPLKSAQRFHSKTARPVGFINIKSLVAVFNTYEKHAHYSRDARHYYLGDTENMTPIIRRWVIHLREKCALKVLYAYIHNSFFIFFLFLGFLIHLWTTILSLWIWFIKKLFVLTAGQFQYEYIQQSLTTMDYLCRHMRPYFFLDVGMYILWFFQFTGFILMHAPTQKRYLTIHNYFFQIY